MANAPLRGAATALLVAVLAGCTPGRAYQPPRQGEVRESYDARRDSRTWFLRPMTIPGGARGLAYGEQYDVQVAFSATRAGPAHPSHPNTRAFVLLIHGISSDGRRGKEPPAVSLILDDTLRLALGQADAQGTADHPYVDVWLTADIPWTTMPALVAARAIAFEVDGAPFALLPVQAKQVRAFVKNCCSGSDSPAASPGSSPEPGLGR